VIEKGVNRFSNGGDDEANDEAGLDHTPETRTPGPNVRRGGADPLPFGVRMGPGTREMGLGGVVG